jgi:predicted Zn-dependent peptidase
VTENAASTSTVSLTFPGAGSASEAMGEQGAALLNKCMAWKSASGVSSLVMLRILEDNGAKPFSSVGRTSATVGYTASPDNATQLVSLLATNCDYEKWDLRDAKKAASVLVDDASSNTEIVLTEALYAAAYGAQTPMGRPLYSGGCSTETLKAFRDRSYGINGAVLAATGIPDHEAFVKATEEALDDAPVGSKPVAPTISFMGGEQRIAAPSMGFAHVALAFEGPSSSILANVMKQCLTLSGATGFATLGMLGAYKGTPSAESSTIADALCASFNAPDASIVKRAKSLAKAEALFGMESGSKVLAQGMTSSVLETGTFSAAEISKAYDAVTDKQVADAFATMLKATPALAAVGDIASVDYHGSLVSRFG